MTRDIQNLSSASKLAACVIEIIITLIDTVKMFFWNCLRIVKTPASKAYFVGTYSVAKTGEGGRKLTEIFLFSLADHNQVVVTKNYSASFETNFNKRAAFHMPQKGCFCSLWYLKCRTAHFTSALTHLTVRLKLPIDIEETLWSGVSVL